MFKREKLKKKTKKQEKFVFYTMIERMIGRKASLEHLRCAPFRGDQGIMIRLIPEVITELGPVRTLDPSARDLEAFRVDAHKVRICIAIGFAQGGNHNFTSGRAMSCVRCRYSVFVHFLRFQDLSKVLSLYKKYLYAANMQLRVYFILNILCVCVWLHVNTTFLFARIDDAGQGCTV